MKVVLFLIVGICGVHAQKGVSKRCGGYPSLAGLSVSRDPCGNTYVVSEPFEELRLSSDETLPGLLEFLSMTTRTKPPSRTPTTQPSSFPSATRSRPPSHAPTKVPMKNPTRLPSALPSILPSIEPSVYPSVVPSRLPSDTPSVQFWHLPSREPSILPSVQPSLNPSIAPTTGPTENPSSFPSLGPSILPSSSPTDVPTLSPFPTSSAPPSAERKTISPSADTPTQTDVLNCETKNGFFGALSNNAVVVQFGYELEIDPLLVESTVEEEVLPDLEADLNSFLLPVAFPLVCDHDTAASSREESILEIYASGSSGTQSILGISTRPDDSILREAGCKQAATDGNVCNVVRAQITLYTDGSRRLEVGKDEIIETLRQGMSEGAFDDADPSIVRVSFYELDELETLADDSEPTPLRGQQGDTGGGLVVGIVLIAAGAVMLAVGAIVYRRRKSRKNENEPERQDTFKPVLEPIVIPVTSSADPGGVPEPMFSPTESSIFTSTGDSPTAEPTPTSARDDESAGDLASTSDDSSALTFPTMDTIRD